MHQTKINSGNREQTVCTPADLHLPAGAADITVRAMGNEQIIAPAENTWDSFFLDPEFVSSDFMPERTQPKQQDRESFED
ncbi:MULTISPECIES: type II toxin-antitoxin system VapB family antitoxin [unclassified Pseudomonas]|uniref:type II toxin-antitoxin system VapB family antitoxin n=1 Tax=unclassified Pseudomonas TaxID=196821 RepID=UPI00131F504D|nr:MULTISPECIES: type II toxin-antitoxin system VapB family antitoxin [unclassified Pseudomonas]NWA83357.1 AbrB/MazE/SpoVT family DNA-binding domain-containing protein [Pseudomonas sp. D2002]QHD08632.1 antitoxin [Pseudomonas sp. R76]